MTHHWAPEQYEPLLIQTTLSTGPVPNIKRAGEMRGMVAVRLLLVVANLAFARGYDAKAIQCRYARLTIAARMEDVKAVGSPMLRLLQRKGVETISCKPSSCAQMNLLHGCSFSAMSHCELRVSQGYRNSCSVDCVMCTTTMSAPS